MVLRAGPGPRAKNLRIRPSVAHATAPLSRGAALFVCLPFPTAVERIRGNVCGASKRLCLVLMQEITIIEAKRVTHSWNLEPRSS